MATLGQDDQEHYAKQLGLSTPELSVKAKDLKALRDAAVDAASIGASLWLSYLFLLFYLAIAVSGVTHRDLFYENPVKLPFLGVDLPLIAFFWIAPLLFLIVHAYVLLHLVQVADKLRVFNDELSAQLNDEDVCARLRRQLPSNIFVQLLAGPSEMRSGVRGVMLWLIARISLVIAPLLLLILIQLQFLPYHSALTWWHRAAVVADLALLWLLWPAVVRRQTTAASWWKVVRAKPVMPSVWAPVSALTHSEAMAYDLVRLGKVTALALASLMLAVQVITVATYPGEWLQENLPSLRFIPWKDGKLATLHELLVAGPVDISAQRLNSLSSNRIVLPGIDVIEHAKYDTEMKLAGLPETISLRSRRLEDAVLTGANLRKADFSAAILNRANLDNADLRNAKFECMPSTRGGSTEVCAQLNSASLNGAALQGASLERAELIGAHLENA
jgi:Pentapeptide repeats (8 copies)